MLCLVIMINGRAGLADGVAASRGGQRMSHKKEGIRGFGCIV